MYSHTRQNHWKQLTFLATPAKTDPPLNLLVRLVIWHPLVQFMTRVVELDEERAVTLVQWVKVISAKNHTLVCCRELEPPFPAPSLLLFVIKLAIAGLDVFPGTLTWPSYYRKSSCHVVLSVAFRFIGSFFSPIVHPATFCVLWHQTQGT